MSPIDPVLRYWFNEHLRTNALMIPHAYFWHNRLAVSTYSPIGFTNWVYNILEHHHPHKPATYADYYEVYWRHMNGH